MPCRCPICGADLAVPDYLLDHLGLHRDNLIDGLPDVVPTHSKQLIYTEVTSLIVAYSELAGRG